MPLIGNKVIERDLRDWLDANGYFGRSAVVEELELTAIRRPGWEQIFRFRLRAKRQDRDEWNDLRGLIRDDERHRTEFQHTRTDAEFDDLFAKWSENLIVSRRRDRGALEMASIWLTAVILAVLAFVALLKSA